MAQHYPILDVGGSAYEMGRQHGATVPERVARSVEIYRGAFQRSAGQDWARALERAQGFAETIKALDADLLTEMKGIADGAGFPLEEIVAINCRTEILFGSPQPAKGLAEAETEAAPAPCECTTIAVTPLASAGGKTILGKNWDWRAACMDTVVVVRAVPENGPRFVMTVEAGMVARDGFNEHGIAVTGNLLRSVHDGGRGGIPVPVIRRRILNSRRLDDALAAVTKADRAASTNYVIAHESGIVINFEASPEQVYALYPERGLLTHSNHFLAVAAQVQGIGKDVGADSLYRHQRARDLVEPKLGRVTVKDVQAALSDHAGHPKSICRHPDPRDPESGRSASIASLVTDLTARVVWVASGPPCCHPFRPITLPGEERVVEGAAAERPAALAGAGTGGEGTE